MCKLRMGGGNLKFVLGGYLHPVYLRNLHILYLYLYLHLRGRFLSSPVFI